MSSAGPAAPSSDAGRLRAMRPALERRARVLRALREVFQEKGFWEVETPVRLAAPAQELHVDAEPAGGMYLRASPELHMKRLLAAGYSRIYQIGPCFRRGERGALHHPEYTMLEWYRTGADYRDALQDTKQLIRAADRAVREVPSRSDTESCPVDVSLPWIEFTVREVFERWAGWNPVDDWDPDRFDIDLVQCVEPHLPRDRAVVLRDYPAPAAALARLSPDQPDVAERWELYMNGVEIANAYSELTDPAEQRHRFEACAAERAAADRPAYPLDEAFLAALESGMPPSAGVALGLDRLVLVLSGAHSLDEVIAFRD